MIFEQQKKDVLARLDKSKKGSIDKPIKMLVDLVNSLPDYYTSSSCSGRVLLIERKESGRKDESMWLFSSHSKVSGRELRNALEEIPSGKVWLKRESMIIHICCRDLESAKSMLGACQDAGLKRTGIVALGKRIMIESLGTERIDALMALAGNAIVPDSYFDIMASECNMMHDKNLARIEKLYSEIEKLKEKNSKK